MNIPELPIDFHSIAMQGVTMLGAFIGAIAAVIVLSSLIRMGFRWVREAFASDIEGVEVDAIEARRVRYDDTQQPDYRVDGKEYIAIDRGNVWAKTA